MAMSVSASGNDGPMVDMNTTPLIDVMLVLLIMFIITLPVMTNNTKIQMPGSDGGRATSEAIQLAVEYDGTILWNGAVVENFTQLEQYFRAEAAKLEQAELHVRPDRRAQYDHVAKVLATAQRSGMKYIGFEGQEQYLRE